MLPPELEAMSTVDLHQRMHFLRNRLTETSAEIHLVGREIHRRESKRVDAEIALRKLTGRA